MKMNMKMNLFHFGLFLNFRITLRPGLKVNFAHYLAQGEYHHIIFNMIMFLLPSEQTTHYFDLQLACSKNSRIVCMLSILQETAVWFPLSVRVCGRAPCSPLEPPSLKTVKTGQ